VPVRRATAGGDGFDPREPSARSIVYRHDTVIAASPQRIWSLLVDLPAYSSWNPWVVRAAGEVRRGGEATVQVMLGAWRMRARHRVLTVDPERRFCWRDAGWNARFVYAQRCRELTVRPDGTVLVAQTLLIDGVLSRLAAVFMGWALTRGMAAESAALKRRAESG
jgi:hypothetical protein